MGSNAVGGGRLRRASGPGLAGSTSVGVLAAGAVGALLAAVVPGVILVVAGVVGALLAAVVPGVILVVAGVVLARIAAVLRGIVVRLLRVVPGAAVRVVLPPGVLLGGPHAELGRQEHRFDHVHDGVADLDGLRHLGRVAGALDLVPVDGELARGRPGERVVALALLHQATHGVEHE